MLLTDEPDHNNTIMITQQPEHHLMTDAWWCLPPDLPLLPLPLPRPLPIPLPLKLPASETNNGVLAVAGGVQLLDPATARVIVDAL
jgi:hypothetical protein